MNKDKGITPLKEFLDRSSLIMESRLPNILDGVGPENKEVGLG